ncbi:MAG TPA: hypothetical protein VH373_05150 [Jatrophihabitantaceae bacterium]|jgi:hypothetical protein
MPPHPVSRRTFLAGASVAAATAALASPSRAAAAAPSTGGGVELHWLDGPPATSTGAAWGVPWPRGQVARGASFALTTSSGTPVPVQTWPLAYWPDGSLKFTGHAVAADAGLDPKLTLGAGSPATPSQPVSVQRKGGDFVLSNGVVDVRVPASGPLLVRSIARGGRTTAQNGRLVLQLQDGPEGTVRTSSWTGTIEDATVEQSGPVRAVVRLSGYYRNGPRKLLPWTVRIYLGAGAESLRLMHSFIWDGNVQTDFVAGLGLEIQVPMSDDPYNRHVRFAGPDRGVWGEPVLVLTGLRRDPGAAVRAAQVAGTATPPPSQWAATVRDGYTALAQWNDFTLAQHSAAQCAVWKRTSANGSWLKHAGFADRAPGFGYVGGVSGGLGFGLRDFWQQFPRALDVRDATKDTATVTLWSWSPHTEAMDMRPYDTAGHGLDLAYEDNRYGFGIPTGVSRSTDMELWAFAATPSRDRIADLADTLATRPQIVADPDTYHAAGVFGRWSLPDRSTPARATLEDSIANDVSFYAGQVEDRQWYGFWHYGDVMHTYDADRHTWRYDVGGFAWDNAELGSDAALWYAFLRSGDPKTFHLAHAMTRHVSESDTYHSGPFAGLGSRHEVQHWGDGAKEPRVGESFTKRFMYYLTADELVGDWLHSSLQVDDTLLKYPPLRDILDTPTGVRTVIRIGPDWYALVSNWLTEWERTGNNHYRDLIVTGMQDIAGLSAGLFAGEDGGAVGFDPATGHISDLKLGGDFAGGYNLAMAFCGDQIMWETIDVVDVPQFRQTLLEFAQYVQATSAERIAHYGFNFDPQVFKTIYSRVTAWAGEQLNDATLRQRGWDQFTSDPAGRPWPAPVHVDGDAVFAPVDEIPQAKVADGTVATNDAAQRIHAIVSLLAIAPDEAP